MKRAALACVLVLLLAGASACGEGGSNPATYPEVRYQVEPLEGTATFEVESLAGGQIEYTSLAGTVFTATSVFNFVLEGAGPPYSGRFKQVGEGAIRVRLVVTGGGADLFRISDGPGSTITLQTAANNPPALRPPDPEVRFDVCAPVPGVFSCYVDDEQPGTFGIQFSGTMGDIDTTHQLGQRSAADPVPTTPSIYFLQKPQEAVSAVFRSTNSNELVARLYIDGKQESVAAGTEDVVVRKDL
ncbi:hypothetical protein L6Q96_09920 [Candidatus Binatia bacterium]|nr:hypothetical protein [Candidatus Binatia bacterium]